MQTTVSWTDKHIARQTDRQNYRQQAYGSQTDIREARQTDRQQAYGRQTDKQWGNRPRHATIAGNECET